MIRAGAGYRPLATERGLLWGLALLLFAVHGAFFAAVFKLHFVSDLQIHAAIVRVGIETGTWWGTPLPYITAAGVAGFRVDAVHEALTLVVAVAVAAKYLVSVEIAKRESSGPLAGGLVVLLALLSFAFSLPANSIYLGQLPPNVFHNSTVIFLMPFALALFWFSVHYLRNPDNRSLVAIALLGALNVLSKPSFVFPLLVVFPLAALIRFRLSPAFWKAAGASALIALFVGLQYLYVYESGSTEEIYDAAGFGGEAESQVRIDVFHVWSYFSENIPVSIVASLVFPLVAFAAYRHELAGYDLVRFAAALMAVSVLIFALFKETGVREFQGNFAWQAMISNYILFLVVLIRLWSIGAFARLTRRSALVGAAFAAHLVAGAVFLTYYFANESYL